MDQHYLKIQNRRKTIRRYSLFFNLLYAICSALMVMMLDRVVHYSLGNGATNTVNNKYNNIN